jgi:catechol 2,3-dioxygenase-like lactoylglutathione lyase family enzyme
VPLNHVALTVSDRERSAEFYGRHFDLAERVHEDDQLLILADGGGSLLALSEGSVPGGLPRTNHFGFQLEGAEQVNAARRRLREAGVIELEWQAEGPTRVQVADPDGYRVEFYAY